MAKEQREKKSRKSKSKPKQESFEGMEPVEIAEVTKAAEVYVDARDERMQLTEQEVEKQELLVTAMKKHGLDKYRTPDGLLVTLVPGKEKAKVKRAGEDPVPEL